MSGPGLRAIRGGDRDDLPEPGAGLEPGVPGGQTCPGRFGCTASAAEAASGPRGCAGSRSRGPPAPLPSPAVRRSGAEGGDRAGRRAPRRAADRRRADQRARRHGPGRDPGGAGRAARVPGMAALFVSHDLAVIGDLRHRVAIMRDGQVVEQGPTGQVIAAPRHDYTRELLAAVLGWGSDHGRRHPAGRAGPAGELRAGPRGRRGQPGDQPRAIRHRAGRRERLGQDHRGPRDPAPGPRLRRDDRVRRAGRARAARAAPAGLPARGQIVFQDPDDARPADAGRGGDRRGADRARAGRPRRRRARVAARLLPSGGLLSRPRWTRPGSGFRTSSRVGSASGSRSPARSPSRRACSCSTSPPARSTSQCRPGCLR